MVIKLNRWSWIMVVGKGKKAAFIPLLYILFPQQLVGHFLGTVFQTAPHLLA